MSALPINARHLDKRRWRRAMRRDVLAPGATVLNASGSASQITAALAALGPGGRLNVKGGPYKVTDGSPIVPLAGQQIWFEDDVVIDGAVTLTGWTLDGTSGKYYVSGVLPAAYTPDSAAQCEIFSGAEANPCKLREWAFIDGVHMTRYMVLADVVSGGFYADYSANRVYIADNPTGHTITMSRAQYAINTTVAGVDLRGGTWTHFSSPAQQGAVYVSGADWEISDASFVWNHALGLYLATGSDRAPVHDCKFNYNGQIGMTANRGTGYVFEDNELAYNNTDGFYGADWESGGFKFARSHNALIRRNHIHHNRGVGAWFDIDNDNPTLGGKAGDGNLIEYNYTDGVRFEISFGAQISYNVVRYNGRGLAYDGGRNSDYSLYATCGIAVNSSPDVEIHHNKVVNNENGIGGQMRSRGSSSELGTPYDLHNLYVHHNDITQKPNPYVDVNGVTHSAGFDKGTGEGVSGVGTLSPIDPTAYIGASNNRFDYNSYHVESTTARRFAWISAGAKTTATWATAQTNGMEPHGTIDTN